MLTHYSRYTCLRNMADQIDIFHCRKEDSPALVAYMDAIAGESKFLTFSGGSSPYTVDEETAFIEGLERRRDGVLMCAKVRKRIHD